MRLTDLGWTSALECEFGRHAKRGWIPARVSSESVDCYTALTIDSRGQLAEITDVVLSGKVWHETATDAELPAVGDWVAIEPGHESRDHVIRARLSRRSCFSRKIPGKGVEEQVIAANVDAVVVVTDPGPDFNPRRLERYFALIARSGALPVVLVNKSDLFPAEQVSSAVSAIRELHPEVEVHAVSATTTTGLQPLHELLQTGATVCLVGSSGVGKSTITNHLLGDDWQDTGHVNEVTGKGRHTTIARSLLPLPGAGLLIDNPGMREVQMWTDEKTLRENFADVEAVSSRCQFHDCKHGRDRGCAIRAAVESGELDSERVESFLSLDEEISRLRERAKKRRIASERWAKRNHRVKARNLNDRIELEREESGEWR